MSQDDANEPASLDPAPAESTAETGPTGKHSRALLPLGLAGIALAVSLLSAGWQWQQWQQQPQVLPELTQGLAQLVQQQQLDRQQWEQLQQQLERTQQEVQPLASVRQQQSRLQQAQDTLQQQLANQRASQQGLQQEQLQRISEQQYQLSQVQDQQQSLQLGLQHLQRQLDDQQGISALLQQNRQLLWAEYQQLARQYANLVDTLALQGQSQLALSHYRQLLQLLAPFELQDAPTFAALQGDLLQFERLQQTSNDQPWRQLEQWLAEQAPPPFLAPSANDLPSELSWAAWRDWLQSWFRIEHQSVEQLRWQLTPDLALWHLQQQLYMARAHWQLGQHQSALDLLNVRSDVLDSALAGQQDEWLRRVALLTQTHSQPRSQASVLLSQWGIN